MILHASIAADDPERTAEMLAKLLNGRALPLPGDGGGWMALALDDNGTLIEVLGRGREYHYRAGEHCDMVWGEPRRNGATHLMLETPLDEVAVRTLAFEYGLRAQKVKHGPFDVIEFWIDECQMFDVMPPAFAAQYKALLALAKPTDEVAA